MLIKDYNEWYFSALLQELRPPKITENDYVELVDRVEKLSRGGLREPTGEEILQLLEKYRVVVPKEVLMSLLTDKSKQGGPQKKLVAKTQRQLLAAPKPEAPPKWNLGCCKGLHETLALECRVKPRSSLYYQLGKMYHNDHVRHELDRTRTGRRDLTSPPPSPLVLQCLG